jgi:hypothetical protein
MERLFSPCTRYRDLEESRGHVPPEWLLEHDLNVSTDEFLSAERGFTYSNLHTMLANGETMIWLTPHAAIVSPNLVRVDRRVVHNWRRLQESCHIRFIADGQELGIWAHSCEALSDVCDVVLQLLAASVVHSVILLKWGPLAGTAINATSLAYLMEQCQSLKALTLRYLALDEDHCRLLGTNSRPNLEVNLENCVIAGAGSSALAEALRRNQGPTRLNYCDFDTPLLGDGLRGNSRLKSFRQSFSGDFDVGNRQVFPIANALRENKGLVELALMSHNFYMNDETWGAICDSLKTHPTLEVLNLRGESPAAPAITTSRIQALLGMMEVNTSILTIYLRKQYRKHELFRELVVPYLETNQFRQHVCVIQKTLPSLYRAKVLGRALLAVRTDPNRFWMLLSGNAEVAFPATTASTTLPASLPTLAIATTSSNTDGASTVATATAIIS